MKASFLLDAPRTLAAGDGPATSQHPIAVLGTFRDPRYGTFSVTRRDYASWVRNMRELQNGRIPIDFDHGPEETGNTKAAGWVTELAITPGTDIPLEGINPAAEYVLATIEWTPRGAQAVKDREYLFVSPTFGDEFADEQGGATGPYMHGVALTNRPFLRRGMPAISLSITADDLERPTPVSTARVSDTPSVPDLKTLRTALKLDDTVSDEDVLAAAVKLAQSPPATNQPEDRRTLKARLEAEGLVVLTAEQDAAAKKQLADLTASAARGEAASLALHEQKFTAQVKACRTAGQLDAVEDTEKLWRGFYDKDPDGTLKLMQSLPKGVVKTTPVGESGSDVGDAPAGVHTLRHRIDQRARTLVAEAKKNGQDLDYGDAAEQAAAEIEQGA